MGSEGKIMIMGIGWIGGLILEFISRIPGSYKIIIADKNEQMALGNAYGPQQDIGIGNLYSARGGSAHLDLYPEIDFVPIDLFNLNETANKLKEINPDIIIYTAALGAPRYLRKDLPFEIHEKIIDGGYAIWLPMHLTLMYKFMQAVKSAKLKAHVVSLPFPDLVNPVLGKLGLAPTVGCGNLDNSVPGIKKIVSDSLHVPMRDVSVFLVASHSIRMIFLHKGIVRGLPFLLRIHVGGQDVTGKFDPDALMFETRRTAPGLTASAAIKNALAILDDKGIISNAPGPIGLPGGFPVRLDKNGAQLALPADVEIKDAVRINEKGLELDGVAEIKPDGTVVYTENAVHVMKEIFRYDCKELKIEECETRYKELKQLYNQLVERYK